MDAFAVGVAQVALMAPALLFLPMGGLVADRGNARRLLLRYHLLYAMPPLALGAVLAMGGLSYPLLIAYGLAAGSIGAFAVPTRDALLPAVAQGNLPRAVALATALQFVGQLIGIACASQADASARCRCWCGHAALVLLGASPCGMLPDPPPHPPAGIRASGGASPTASPRPRAPSRSGRCCCSTSASACSMSGRSWPCCRSSCATSITAAPPRSPT